MQERSEKELENVEKWKHWKRFKCELKTTKIMIVRRKKDEVETIDERNRAKCLIETDIITLKKLLPKKKIWEIMCKKRAKNQYILELNAIGAKCFRSKLSNSKKSGTEEIRVKLKLFEIFLMPVILLGPAACWKIWKGKWMKEIKYNKKHPSNYC